MLRIISSKLQVCFTCNASNTISHFRTFSKLTVIENGLNTSDSELKSGHKCSENIKIFYKKLLTTIMDGGGPKGIHRHTIVNKKVLVRERLKHIFDRDTPLLEVAPLAGMQMDYGDLPAAGAVAMIGKIHGLYCVVGGSDATLKGGAIYPIGVVKQLRGQAISFINYLPAVHVVDSAGAFLPLQAEIFPDRNHGGRTFRNEAVLSSRGIPQLAIVAGSCTAGGAYAPTMTEEVIIVKDIGLIYLGGPPLVKAATGEIVTDQELGGADMHCRISGCTDFFAESEEDAFEMCRDSILTLNLDYDNLKSNHFANPLYNDSGLGDIAGKMEISKTDMYQVLARILDASAFKEFKALFGKNLIAGFGYIKGDMVGILANAGPLTSADGQKGTHLIELCDRRGIPLIFLQNSATGSLNNNTDWQDGIVLKERAKMVYAHSCAKVPKISINVGGCFEDDNFIMCGASFKPNFIFSWPLAQTSLHPPNDERNELIKKVSEVDDYTDTLFEDPTSAFYLASRVHLDGVVLPEETRDLLSLCLEIIKSGERNKCLASQRKVRMPLLRM